MKTQTTASGGVGLGRGGRMSRQRKRDAVVRLLRGEDLEILSRALGVTAATLTGWRDTFVAAGEASLATRPTDGEALETERLKAKLGEMLLERELLDAKIAALEANRPLARRRARRCDGPSSPQVVGLMAWPACAGSGAPHAPPSTAIFPPLGPNRRGVRVRVGRCRMRPCWRRSVPSWAPAPFTAKVTGRSGPDCASQAFARPSVACCGSCASTTSSPPRGSARPEARATTTAPSSPTRWTRCGPRT